jgi:hypothetical protein
VKSRWKIFTTATVALALNLLFASAALAHGGVADGHAEQLLGIDWLILGGAALFGLLYAVSRLRG